MRWRFHSDAAAHGEFVFASYSRAQQDSDYRELSSSIADERKMYRRVLGPDPSTFETQIVTIWRRGKFVATVNTIGSSDISPEEHRRLVDVVDARIQALVR